MVGSVGDGVGVKVCSQWVEVLEFWSKNSTRCYPLAMYSMHDLGFFLHVENTGKNRSTNLHERCSDCAPFVILLVSSIFESVKL